MKLLIIFLIVWIVAVITNSPNIIKKENFLTYKPYLPYSPAKHNPLIRASWDKRAAKKDGPFHHPVAPLMHKRNFFQDNKSNSLPLFSWKPQIIF